MREKSRKLKIEAEIERLQRLLNGEQGQLDAIDRRMVIRMIEDLKKQRDLLATKKECREANL